MPKRYRPSHAIRSGATISFHRAPRQVTRLVWVHPLDDERRSTLRWVVKPLAKRVQGRVNHGTQPLSRWWSVLLDFGSSPSMWEAVRRQKGETRHVVRRLPRHRRLHEAMRAAWLGYMDDVEDWQQRHPKPQIGLTHRKAARLFARARMAR